MTAAQEGATTVTAIVACHNAATTVESVLDDLAAAAAACPSVAVDVIVVDDASTDDTADVLSRRDDVTVLTQRHNDGVCAARERGLEHATGQFVWFVDADDRIPMGALASFAGGLTVPRVDVVIGTSVSIAEGSAVPSSPLGNSLPIERRNGRDALTGLLRGEVRGQLWDKVIRRTVLDSSAFTGSKVHSDVPITACALATAGTVVDVDGLVYAYTVRPGSIIGSFRRRADSVMVCAESVLRRALAAGVDGPTVAYFRAWFVGLSLYRDLSTSDYDEAETRKVSQIAKSSLSWSAVVAALRIGSRRRAVSIALATMSGGMFLAVRLLARVRRTPDRPRTDARRDARPDEEDTAVTPGRDSQR